MSDHDPEMKKIVTDPEILFFAIVDGINIFLRDVLIPEGILDEAKYFGDDEQRLLANRDEIALEVAKRWEISWFNES